MKEKRVSFRNLSPRILGLITGFSMIMYYVGQTGSLFLDYAKEQIEQDSMYSFDSVGMITGLTAYDLITAVISCLIVAVRGSGLIKNHPKIIIAGLSLSALEVLFYTVIDLLNGEGIYISAMLNGITLVTYLLMLASIVTFKETLAKATVLIVAVIKLLSSAVMFLFSARVLYSAEGIADIIGGLALSYNNAGLASAFITILLSFYIYVLITYEGRDIQEDFTDETEEKYAYINIYKHTFLFVFELIWSLIWVHRTTKVMNEISRDGKIYSPAKEVLKQFIPFYPFYWSYTQAKRLEGALNKCGVEENGMGTVAVVMNILTAFGGEIYLQDKINEYCIISDKKLRKKSKYVYDENEGIVPEYPVDTTEQKPTEIVIDE
ncbi:MAG: DUF4234 domain-containing protein [Clostridia bacterium]|nr:DUF4234 domain-containing protein [Clostridia bacterium]